MRFNIFRTSDSARQPWTRDDLLPFVVACMGLCALYLPTGIDLFSGPWSSTRNGHGPFMFTVGLWFLYFRACTLSSVGVTIRAAPLAGLAVLMPGLCIFVLGRSQTFVFFEAGSFVVVLTALVLMFFGPGAVRHLGFGFFFLIFMVPLPPSFVDVLTLPLKISVSYCVEHILYALHYPVARSGVILIVGHYQLLVADACSGLNSLFTLEAMGLLYMNIVRYESGLRNVTLALLIMPISFISNITRVMFLCMITYYLGDDMGQGFLHGFAGIVLFLTALVLTIGVDSGLRYLSAKVGRIPAVKHAAI
jgi:exosortase B